MSKTRKWIMFLGCGGPNGQDRITIPFVCDRWGKGFTVTFNWHWRPRKMIPDLTDLDPGPVTDREFHQLLYDGGYIDLQNTMCPHCHQRVLPPRKTNPLSRLMAKHRLATEEQIYAPEIQSGAFIYNEEPA